MPSSTNLDEWEEMGYRLYDIGEHFDEIRARALALGELIGPIDAIPDGVALLWLVVLSLHVADMPKANILEIMQKTVDWIYPQDN